MISTNLLIVSDARGREVAAVLDGPDLIRLRLESGERTRREVSEALRLAQQACPSPLRRLSLAEAADSLAERIDLSLPRGDRSTPDTMLTVRRVDASGRTISDRVPA